MVIIVKKVIKKSKMFDEKHQQKLILFKERLSLITRFLFFFVLDLIYFFQNKKKIVRLTRIIRIKTQIVFINIFTSTINNLYY